MYQALYRSWRPTRFADIVGQQAIVRTLLNQIKSGRISHAYLFCGTRGSGKTTTARILAIPFTSHHVKTGYSAHERAYSTYTCAG